MNYLIFNTKKDFPIIKDKNSKVVITNLDLSKDKEIKLFK